MVQGISCQIRRINGSKCSAPAPSPPFPLLRNPFLSLHLHSPNRGAISLLHLGDIGLLPHPFPFPLPSLVHGGRGKGEEAGKAKGEAAEPYWATESSGGRKSGSNDQSTSNRHPRVRGASSPTHASPNPGWHGAARERRLAPLPMASPASLLWLNVHVRYQEEAIHQRIMIRMQQVGEEARKVGGGERGRDGG